MKWKTMTFNGEEFTVTEDECYALCPGMSMVTAFSTGKVENYGLMDRVSGQILKSFKTGNIVQAKRLASQYLRIKKVIK